MSGPVWLISPCRDRDGRRYAWLPMPVSITAVNKITDTPELEEVRPSNAHQVFGLGARR